MFIQFRCLNAPNQEDAYCHDHKNQIQKWGRMIWPCRELQFNREINVYFFNNFSNLSDFFRHLLNFLLIAFICLDFLNTRLILQYCRIFAGILFNFIFII